MAENVHRPGRPANRLLASLPDREYRRLLPLLGRVPLNQGQVLYGAGEQVRQVYFPDSGLVSLVAGLGAGKVGEAGVVGKEGVVGVPALFARGPSPFLAMAPIPGAGWMLPAATLREELPACRTLAGLLDGYLGALLVQLGRAMACNAHHPLERRCGRWLAQARYLVGADEFPLTRKYLGLLLGAGRPGATEAADRLRRAGLIRYRRGHLTVLDGWGLESAACECYRVIKGEYDRLPTPG